MRDGIRNDPNVKDGKIVRGDQDTGEVYLHHGFSKGLGLVDGERRKEERSGGGEVVFDKLRVKLGYQAAQQIFSDIGKERKRDLKEEFKVSDFQRIDDRVIEMERDRLNLLSHNWEQHLPTGISVPDSLREKKTWSEPDREVQDFSKNGIGDYTVHMTTERGEEHPYMGVRDDVNDRMQTRVNRRLDEESNGGRIVLGEGRINQIIGEEFKKIVDGRNNNNR
jgi:hypothetical protein